MALPAVDTLARAGNEFLPFLWLHIVLLIHSAVVKTPKTQPFHAVLMAMRCVTVVIMIMAVATFVAGLLHPPPPPGDRRPLRAPWRWARKRDSPELHDLLYPW
ncbi:unnamed protein product [Symbiodinium natans]|uniref:Uncharacterized protein n=1 Tax=Symbiodinium natans TaxID=878477 RepID=A0A812IE51_9DINO|nr:unnamed protein product [Symbiodinium natans]